MQPPKNSSRSNLPLNPDYPRMMFHRTLEPVTVQSADEESALGEGWARTIWPAEAVPEPEWAPLPPVMEYAKNAKKKR